LILATVKRFSVEYSYEQAHFYPSAFLKTLHNRYIWRQL